MSLIYGLFNIFLGIFLFLIAVNRLKLNKPVSPQWSLFLKIAGVGLVVWGIIKVYLAALK